MWGFEADGVSYHSFMNMAWNPERYAAGDLLEHTRVFCAQQFGEEQADEAMRILNLYCKYNGRVTPEMLDKDTYHLASGEWRQVADEYVKLEAEALRQYLKLDTAYRDAYRQLILFLCRRWPICMKCIMHKP